MYARLTLLVLLALWQLAAFCQSAQWRTVDKGLQVGTFDSPVKSDLGDSKITIVKIDPRFYAFKLMSASEQGGAKRTAKQWCQQKNLIAAINAGMFQIDGVTSVGYMKNYTHINNGRVNNYKAVVAFNPTVKGVPEFQIIDRACQDFDELKPCYQSLIQNLRMISLDGKNMWSESEKKWSTVALGVDKHGQVLFIFVRSPYSVHTLIDILLSLPIDILNAAYLEGGPEASLYFSHNGTVIDSYGSYETSFLEDNGNPVAWPIPNVIGIVRK